ncbi:putative membrane protein [Clostridium bornimense]|uniref:Putative membrane protein n=2 Tax=Clostridium bornimense TaxID=1216932 RepID=W6S0W7_9CLOT|nr:putative membrane protein [Clostridium bornimense]
MNYIMDSVRSVSYAIASPKYIVFILIFAYIIYRKNLKNVRVQKMLFGRSVNMLPILVISQLFFGIIAGVFASVLLYIFKVNFYQESYIEIIFLISLILMILKPKYVCFAYSGAILGGVSIVYNIMIKANLIDRGNDLFYIPIGNLLILVGVIHFIEGLLVAIDGNRGSIPVFTRINGEIRGGFAFNRVWIMPMSLILFQSVEDPFASIPISHVPAWILATGALAGFEIFYGAVGYKSVTFTKSKTAKVLISGSLISSYGIIMILLGVFSRGNLVMETCFLLLMPLLHEVMLYLDREIEERGEAKFVSNDEGIKVLEVGVDSLAYEMGIKSGDTLIEINDKRIQSIEDITESLNSISNFTEVKIKAVKGELKKISCSRENSKKPIGLVLVPKDIRREKVVPLDGDKFKNILEKVKKKYK